MILLSLALMLASLCLLVVGLVDGLLSLMVGSVAASVAAGVVLYLAARRRHVAVDAAGPPVADEPQPDTGPHRPVTEHWEPPPPPSGQWPPQPPADEPPEEQVSPADAMWIAQRQDEVTVIDGRPRYHQSSCPHLIGRSTVPLPVAEARDAGFTPCALCRPDADLLSRR